MDIQYVELLDKRMIEDIVNSNRFDYIDLGLPSRTLWATQNIGASSPSDYGLYFQWGDIVGYAKDQVGKDKQFTWEDYKWNPSGDGKIFTKYTTYGDKLELEDDAANVNMGGSWHIPSPKQFKELINNTTTRWTIFNDVSGMSFTSKKDNSKSIFIPASGRAWRGSVTSRNFEGCYWSSVTDLNYVDCVLCLNFFSGYSNIISYNRSNGYSVRGVIG